jgi:CNT family concentrative nucleoside transporter
MTDLQGERFMDQVQSAVGLVIFAAVAWLIGGRRQTHALRIVGAGLAAQILFAALLLHVPLLHRLFEIAGDGVLALAAATEAGTAFVFGYLGGAPAPFETTRPGADFILAFRALPLVIVISALVSLLMYWRILPAVVGAFSFLLARPLGVRGPVSFAAAANIFVGMVEAPLFVRAYLRDLTRAELFIVMTCGMATIAGTVLVLYATLLAGAIEGAAGHLLVASIISAPAAIMMARLMVADGESAAGRAEPFEIGETASGAMEALVQGTEAGLRLFLNIVAMLLVLVALVHLANMSLSLLPDLLGAPVTLQRLLGWVMAPVAWIMGIPWAEAVTGGGLLGTKVVLNELLAYLDLAALPPDALSERSRLILLYALCGFANFGSLGIMVAGLSTMVPERRGDIVALGPLTIVSGMLATCSTGAVIGLLTW